ncbi:hypothetical protein G7Y79_00002g006520 [Physcia stellaris]|nr:hypothetical protein G7Y79_00002g006520 [Physcia stellaris]
MPSTHSQTPYPISTTILSATSLSASPHLPALTTLINTAFSHAHQTGHNTVVLTEQRLHSPTQLLEEIGPDGFCILAFSESGAGELVGTASAKPYTLPGKGEGEGGSLTEVNKLFKRKGEEPFALKQGTSEAEEQEREYPTWELIPLAISPSLQGLGIASQLINLSIEEIKRRVRDAQKEDEEESPGKGKVRILLSTLKELNESFFLRKGWRTTSERRFEAGVGGSEAGFGVVEMGRVVDF